MAKRETKLPQNVELLQRRFNDAQTQFNQQFQQRMSEYTGEVSAFEAQVESYQAKAQAYMDDYNQYTEYLNSFFLKPENNTVQTFVKYGNNYYWQDDISPGFNLKAIDNLGSLSGGDFQFVKTGTQKHAYTYKELTQVPKSRWETESYTVYEMQLQSVPKTVWVPGSTTSIGAPIGSPIGAPLGTVSGGGLGIGSPAFSSPIGTPIVSGISTIKPINLNPGVTTVGSSGNVGGRYETTFVNEFVQVPVTKTRQVWTTTYEDEFVTRAGSESLELGYLKTKTPEGEFTTLRPQDFAVRSEPKAFSIPSVEPPGGVDISDIKAQLEEEVAYLQRATGEVSASARQARMRQRVRPLLADTGEA
jgi:hypothetical protein